MSKKILLPASVGIAVLLACVVALLAALASAPAASAASRDHGASFAVRCDFSHRLSDDPIVHPGEPGAAHSHDFLGNTTTKFDSTYGSMSKSGTPTTCSRPEDTAGYWIPTVSWKDQKGTQTLKPTRAVFYYRAGDKDYRRVQPFAKDLRIIADKDVNGARIRWYCGTGDDKAGSPDPPTRCSGAVLGLKIVFPDCVAKGDLTPRPGLKDVDKVAPGNNYEAGALRDLNSGQVIDPDTGQVIDIDDGDDDHNDGDHRLHMTRSKPQNDGTRACPSTHPIPVPTLTINANFQIPTTSGTVTLSSGDASTIHTDFWNTWNQDKALNLNPPDGRSYGGLNALVKHCINEVPPTSPRPTECRAPTATA
jgi:hypothetical protein